MQTTLEMKAYAKNPYGTAVGVVCRIPNVLDVEGKENARPNTKIVVGFDYLFTAVVETAIAQQIARPSQFKVSPVHVCEGVSPKRQANSVIGTVPFLSTQVPSEDKCAIGLTKLKCFQPSRIPSIASKQSQGIIDLLLPIYPKAIVHLIGFDVRCKIGLWFLPGKISRNGFWIAGHACVIHECEQSKDT